MTPELSIVIPTKDRYQCLIPVIKELEAAFQNFNIEIVVQDNTNDNTEFVNFMQSHPLKFTRYFHIPEQISMSKNCDYSVTNSTGEYVILIGDDDFVFPSIFKGIKWMKENNMEALGNIFSSYQWKDVVTKTIIKTIPEHTYILQRRFKNTYTIIDTKKQLNKVVAMAGGYGPHYLPRLYHGIVKRSALQRVFATCGTHFPGPSPDMAVAVSVACHINQHGYFNGTFSVAGSSKTSNTGLSTEKKNVGKLEDIVFLDKHYIEQWDERIPRVWAVCTIWPQSLVQALKDCGQKANINLAYYYGYILAFAYYISPKVVKKEVWQRIKNKKSIGFAGKVAYYYFYVWATRIYRLLFLRHDLITNITNIGDTYKIAKERYKEYVI
jgi:glycosyltransferase involved in cell wall biosynthesis